MVTMVIMGVWTFTHIFFSDHSPYYEKLHEEQNIHDFSCHWNSTMLTHFNQKQKLLTKWHISSDGTYNHIAHTSSIILKCELFMSKALLAYCFMSTLNRIKLQVFFLFFFHLTKHKVKFLQGMVDTMQTLGITCLSWDWREIPPSPCSFFATETRSVKERSKTAQHHY